MTPIIMLALAALAFVAIFWIYMAAFAMWCVAKSNCFSPTQKYAQYALIWFLPIFGAAIVLHVLSPDFLRCRPSWVPWLDFLLVAAFVSSAATAIEDIAAHSDADAGSSPAPNGDGDD